MFEISESYSFRRGPSPTPMMTATMRITTMMTTTTRIYWKTIMLMMIVVIRVAIAISK